MFIAHQPAGYCLTTIMLSRIVRSKDNRARRRYLLIGMAASLLPDLDLIYFYLIDHCRHPHNAYLPHIPFYWLLVGLWIGACGWLLR